MTCSSKKRFLQSCSQQFNLAIQDLAAEDFKMISEINKLMKKLSILLPTVKLREHTVLRKKCNNLTGWPSIAEVRKQLLELHEYLSLN